MPDTRSWGVPLRRKRHAIGRRGYPLARRTLVLAVIAVLAGACGDGEPAATTTTAGPDTTATAVTTTVVPTTAVATTPALETTTTTTAPTTTIAAPVPAAAPPPASYAEVQDAYEAVVAEDLAEGRTVADLFVNDDMETLHDKLSAAAALDLSADNLRGVRQQIEAAGVLGDVTADRAFQLSPDLRIYQSDLAWGDGAALAMTVAWNAADDITSVSFVPRALLPDDPAADHESAVEYRLPFDGLWHIAWGGSTELENYHIVAPDQRHALDIGVWKDGGVHSGDGTQNTDYWAYGQAVLAPAAGTVVTVVDGQPDETPRETTNIVNPAGNHVVIEVADGEYVLIAHLQPGSITVAEGDVLTAGQQIGLVGNSGNTSHPHIHMHAQDQPVFGQGATGLPMVFVDFVANGEPVERGMPLADQFVIAGE